MITEIYNKEIEIPVNSVKLKGYLRSAENSKGIVLFSHGSGSSRLSTRNNYVADFLLTQGFSSLLFDLLTPQEDSQYKNRFDIELPKTTDAKILCSDIAGKHFINMEDHASFIKNGGCKSLINILAKS